ncbi:TIGR02186 family protein [Halovulum sp. GXIMD14793]
MIRALLCLLALTSPLLAQTERVVGALSQNSVQITANFNGTEIWVFGAVSRDAPVDPGKGPLEVIISVRGPDQELTVRRKERTLGIWANRDAVDIDFAPSFYAIASTGPLEDIASDYERFRYQIGLDHAVQAYPYPGQVEDIGEFKDAVVRIRRDNGLYDLKEGIVELDEETLFRTRIQLPANLVEGLYTARMYLLRDRKVVNIAVSSINVEKTGLERLIYRTAHEQPLLYGLLSLAVALFAGWLASTVFRLLRR